MYFLGSVANGALLSFQQRVYKAFFGTFLMADRKSTLNSRSEILAKCRHKLKFSLSSVKSA